MKIVWHSNAPFAGTGYGNQTDVFVPRFQRAGHQMKVSAFYGLQGAPLAMGDVEMMPGSKDGYGNDILYAHYHHHKPDIMIGLLDIWVLNPDLLKRLPWFNWTPVDHDPLPPVVLQSAMGAKGIIAMSKFGETKLREAGLKNVWYVPHGVDSKIFSPMDRTEARQKLNDNFRLNLPTDAFIAGMVMANKGAPSRKAFDQQIRAFAAFRRDHPEAVLFLHTDLKGMQGEDIRRILELAGLDEDAWRASDQYQLLQGRLGQDYLNHLYNAFDVTMNATRGEGFGIPIMESQMAGTPVIVTDFSAMRELCGAGWKVEYAEKVFTGQSAYQVIPSTESIRDALVQAYKVRGDEDFAKKARRFALKYDADKVYGTHWHHALEEIEAQVKPKEEPKPVAINALARVVKQTVHGIDLRIHENPRGGLAAEAMEDISRHYGLENIDLQDGDWVLDLGANVGVVSCWLAKKFPAVNIVAVEPEMETCGYLRMNVIANGCKNVHVVNKAVSGDGLPVHLYSVTNRNSGASSIYGGYSDAVKRLVESITVRQLMAQFGIERVALLKFDVEGAEYELFNDVPLARIDRVVGEVHLNEFLKKRYNADSLTKMLQTGVKGARLHVAPVPDIDRTYEPDVSVIIPTYNGADTIERAVSSALDIKGLEVQVCVCIDGSTDDTRERLKPYEESSLVLEHPTNLGQHEAMRTATTEATGRYIFFYGDDDWAGAGLVDLVLAMDKQGPETAFAYGPQQYHGIRNDLVVPLAYDEKRLWEHYYPLNGIIYRREVFTEHGCMWWNPPGMMTYPEDYDLILQVITKGLRGMAVDNIPAVLHYTYAAGRQSDNRVKDDDAIMAAFRERWPQIEQMEKAG